MNRAFLLASLLLFWAQGVGAQVFTLPPRVSQPARPQTVQTLVFSASMMGGYDRNMAPTNLPQSVGANVLQSSVAGTADVSLSYSLAKGGRSFNVVGRGSGSTYKRAGGTPGPLYGTVVTANFTNPLGSKTNLFLAQNASRTPYIPLGLFANPLSAASLAYDANTNSLNSLVASYHWSSASSVGLTHSLTRRTRTGVRYTFQTSRYEGPGNNLKDEFHSATADVSQQITRSTDVQTSYRISLRDAQQPGLQYSDVHHWFAVSVRRSQPISSTRTLEISAGGGWDMVQPTGASTRYWRPTYHARLATDIARSWTTALTYTQYQNLLHSPLSGPGSYITHSAVVSAGGNLSRSVGLVVNGGATYGSVPADQSITSTSGEYSGLTAGAQISFALARSISAFLGANYYKTDLSGAANALAIGTSTYQRNAVRVGFHWSVPIFDSSRRR
jgi:hypothetical protein